jgi:mono/diheme cytochrome c family protein
MKLRLRLLGLLAFSCLALPVMAAQVTIDLGHGLQTWTTAQLLARADARTISIPADVAFKRPMHYRAVPLRALLPGLSPGEHLQFVATDGFAAEIDSDLLLDGHGAQAWLAIEDPARPWPEFGKDHAHAGPFYVVWTNSQLAHVSSEQWPYQLSAIRTSKTVAERFPAIFPDASLPATSDIQRGFVAFRRTCFACHTLNGQGDAKLGPDLNIPHNPTEYLRADLLRAFIRDPQSLRRWPQAKMHGLDTQALSDAELDDVLAYLRYMAGRKVAH